MGLSEASATKIDENTALAISILESNDGAKLVSGSGDVVTLTGRLFEIVKSSVEAFAQGQTLSFVAPEGYLTTQEVAKKLGLSRPTVVKLLEAGEIPFEKPGKHRRVRVESLNAYLEKMQARNKILESMENEGDESGIYELTATPIRTR